MLNSVIGGQKTVHSLLVLLVLGAAGQSWAWPVWYRSSQRGYYAYPHLHPGTSAEGSETRAAAVGRDFYSDKELPAADSDADFTSSAIAAGSPRKALHPRTSHRSQLLLDGRYQLPRSKRPSKYRKFPMRQRVWRRAWKGMHEICSRRPRPTPISHYRPKSGFNPDLIREERSH